MAIEITLPRDIVAEFKGIEFKKSLDAPDIVAFLISIGAHIPVSPAADLITAWLLGRFRGHAEILSIDEAEVKFSKAGKIKRIIKRTIKKVRH
jgi:hypothetical protein